MSPIRLIRGESYDFLFGTPRFFRKLWIYAISVRGWGIVHLISDSTNKVIRLGTLAYT